MSFWLAKKREGQDFDYLQRFDPRYWTVDFPRPAMASVISTGPDSLRVDCEFHRQNSLIGLIWESQDRFDHPLLTYETERDYSRTTLSFRWQSSGVIALDQSHGPTLTIEGRDHNGSPKIWYVRIWNYANGSPSNAQIELPFSLLREGWLADGALIDPSDIDRIFLSIVAAGHNPADDSLLPARANGEVELSNIKCDGDKAMLEIGDVLLPSHDLGMATAYDDSYNLTPARILRNTLALGYRGPIVHYVGMSHYFRLEAQLDDTLLVAQPATLCTPCEAWHQSFFEECARLGFQPILSLSYELFAEHCPQEWAQRAYDGSQALTGWVPPSTLLSPANSVAMAYLQSIAVAFVTLIEGASLPVHFQIGEPWWWVTPNGQICIYDDAAVLAAGTAPQITDLSASLNTAQLALLDWAGSMLASSTAALRDAVKASSTNSATVYLLVFTPTVLDEDRPELRRANMPLGWAAPAYDRLQIEDYDWLTQGADGSRRQAYEIVQQRLQYDLADQDYMGGFVLLSEDASDFWRRIDLGLDQAKNRGIEQLFLWAYPQIMRDGYTRLPLSSEAEMQAFDDIIYPLSLALDSSVSAEFSTSVALTASGHERRNSYWSDARLHYDVGPGIRSEAELGVLLEFFRARRGAARGFRLSDPLDHSSNNLTGSPTSLDQQIGVGDSQNASFQLAKSYGPIQDPQHRFITRPRIETILVSIDGAQTDAWSLGEGGRILFNSAPQNGAIIRAGFLFDVAVRFAEDRLDINCATFAAGEAPSVPLIEIREDT